MTNNRIEGITFDLWNTLIVDRAGGGISRADRRIDATVAILAQYHEAYPRNLVKEAYWQSQRKFENVRIRGLDTAFEPQIDDFLDSIDEGLAKSVNPEARDRIAAHHLNAFLEHPPVLMAGTLEVLADLNEQGYKLALICNSGTTPGSLTRKFLAEIGIAQHLLALTFSDEEELAKPAPSLFLETLNTMGVGPQASVHIGDRPETDILGAKRVGMKAVLIGDASWDHVPVTPDARIQHLGELPGVLEALARI